MKKKLWKRAFSALTAAVMIAGAAQGQILSALTEPAITASAESSTGYVQIGKETSDSYSIQGCPVSCWCPYGWSEQIYTADEIGDISEIDALAFNVFSETDKDYEMSLYLKDTPLFVFDNNTTGISVDDASCVWSGEPDFKEQGWSKIEFETPFEHDPEMNLAVIAVYTCTDPDSSVDHAFRAFDTDDNETLSCMTDDNSSALPGGSAYGSCINEKNVIRLYSPSIPNITLSYHSNYPDGTDQVTSETLSAGAPFQVRSGSFDHEGDSFVAWNTAPDGSGLTFAAGYTFENGLDADTDLYAQWADVPEKTVQIGVNTVSTLEFPLDSYYRYGYSEQIYTKEEVGDVGDIDSLSFLLNGSSSGKKGKLYLMDTDMETFTTESPYVPVDDAELVYDGDLPFSETGWANISFDLTFSHDPDKSLMVILINESGSWNEGLSFAAFHGPDNSYTAFMSSDDDSTIPNSEIVPQLTSYRNVIRLHTADNEKIVTVGTVPGSESKFLPMNSYYNYGYSEQLYTAEELGDIRNISMLGWHVKTEKADRQGEIYLMDTEMDKFESANDVVGLEGAKKVYEGEMPFDHRGWAFLPLQDTFAHNPRKNLMVIFLNTTGDYTQGLSFTTIEDDSARSAYYNTDSERSEPSSESASTTKSRNAMVFGSNSKFVTITFEPNGAEGDSYTQQVVGNYESSLIINRFDYPEYLFKGWNTEADGSGTSYDNLETVKITEDTTLYAQWEVFPDYIHSIGIEDYSHQHLPAFFYYKYGYSQQIYTAEEIGDLPLLSGISFKVNTTLNGDFTGELYLMDTEKSAFNDHSETVSLSEATKVYEGPLAFSREGWADIPFSTVFAHDPSKNLIVTFINTSGYEYPGVRFASYSTTYNSFIRYTTDSGYTDPDSHSGLECGKFKNVIRLTAYTGETVKVTYKANGSGEDDIVDYRVKGSTFKIRKDSFKRDDYYVTGWNTKANGSSRAFELGESITRSKDLVLYAQWTPKLYINYNSNDGTDLEAKQYFIPGEKCTLQANPIRRSGYYIESWNTSADGSGTRYEIGDVISPTESFTLYAQWAEGIQIIDPAHHFKKDRATCGIPFTEKYNYCYSVQICSAADIGDNPLLSSISFFVLEPGNTDRSVELYMADVDSSITSAEYPCPISLSEMTRVYSGTFRFDHEGWNKMPFISAYSHDPEKNLMIVCVDNTGKSTDSCTVFTAYGENKDAYFEYSDHALENINGENNDQECFTPSPEIRLGAYPEGEAVKITFKPNGAEGDDEEQIVSKNTATTLRLNTFVRKGYRFTSWNKQPDGSGTSYADGRKVTRTKPLTVYAQWEECPIITYHANGGKGEDHWQNIVGNDVKFLENMFIKKGYKFKEWNTKPDGSGTAYCAGDEIDITSNIDLYAQWTFICEYDFSTDPLSAGWKFIDYDNDGFNWKSADSNYYPVHSGNPGDCSVIISASYDDSNAESLEPDNWAVAPAGKVRSDGSAIVSLWAKGQDGDYSSEHFAIFAANKGAVDFENFEPEQWTMVSPLYITSSEWAEYTADLSDFAGEEVYVAIRHYNVTNEYYLYIDDVSLPFDNTIDVSFKHNCGFNDNLALYYAVPKSDLEDCEDPNLTVYREYYESGASEPQIIQTIITKYTETTIGDKEMYMFEYKGLSSTDMGCKVRAVLTAERNNMICESAVDEYSIQEYVLDRLDKSSNEQYKTMLVDLLNYGAAAQIHFNKDTEHLVNAVLTEEQKALGTQTAPELMNNCNEIEVSGATAAFNGKNLSFDNNVVMALRIKLPENADMSKIKLKVNYTTSSGTEVTKTVKGSSFTQSGEYWIAEVKGIAMTDFRSVMDIAVYSGSKQISNTLQYSVESYAFNRLSNPTTSDSFKALMSAMMNFGISAEEHFS